MSKARLLDQLETKGEHSVKELSTILGLSRQRVHRILNQLLDEKKIIRIGSPPKVFYSVNIVESSLETYSYADKEIELIQRDWILVDPLGKIHRGKGAFEKWCFARNLPIGKTVKEYTKTKIKYDSYVASDDLIDGTQKLLNTKELDVCVDQQFYADFYAIERFGKTKLGQLLHFGKMSQSIKLIQEIVDLTKDRLVKLIHEKGIKSIAYIPPTLKRDIQIMKQLELMYNFSLPKIDLQKVSGEIVIPQKALSKIKDRIQNATNSIRVSDKREFDSILLIDDALGSGATINQTACKLKQFGQVKKVYGFAITGSYKGFEVLSEA